MVVRQIKLALMVVRGLKLQSSLGDRHTHLDSGFGQPGYGNEEFLFQVEAAKMNKQVRDEDPYYQASEDTSQTQPWDKWDTEVFGNHSHVQWQCVCVHVWSSPTVLGLSFEMVISAPIRPKRMGWNTSQARPTIAATGAWGPTWISHADWVPLFKPVCIQVCIFIKYTKDPYLVSFPAQSCHKGQHQGT